MDSRSLRSVVTGHTGGQEKHAELLFQAVTRSAPLGYGGLVPGECQVPAFLCCMHKREVKV